MGLADFVKELDKKTKGKIKPAKVRYREKGDFFSTGVFRIDRMTNGGIPKGAVTEIVGEEGAGKTTLMLQTAAKVIAEGGAVAYLDAEHRLEDNYVREFGIDPDDIDHWVKFRVNAVEDIDATIRKIAYTYPQNNIKLVIIDSVTAVLPEKWMDEDSKGKALGERARFWSDTLPFILKFADDTDIAVALINQFRVQIATGFGAVTKKTEAGGNAGKYYKSLSIAVQPYNKPGYGKEWEEISDELTGEKYKEPVGRYVLVQIGKSSVCKPFQQAICFLRFGVGFDDVVTIRKILINNAYLVKKGNTYEYTLDGETQKAGIGIKQADEWIKNNSNIVKKWIVELVGEDGANYIRG